eukprot:5909778-Ditylum_brightwellii.AAC.1
MSGPENVGIWVYITCWLRDVTRFVSDCSEITVEAVEKIIQMLHFVKVLGLFVMIIIVSKSALLTKYPKVGLNDYCS